MLIFSVGFAALAQFTPELVALLAIGPFVYVVLGLVRLEVSLHTETGMVKVQKRFWPFRHRRILELDHAKIQRFGILEVVESDGDGGTDKTWCYAFWLVDGTTVPLKSWRSNSLDHGVTKKVNLMLGCFDDN